MTLKKLTFTKLLAMLLVFAVLGTVYAGVQRIAYQTTRGALTTTANIHTDVTAITSQTWSSPVTPYYTKSNPNIGVEVSTDVSGTVVGLAVGLYHYYAASGTYKYLGMSDIKTITISGTSPCNIDSTRWNQDDYIQFETNGANVFDVRIVSITNGAGTAKIAVNAWGVGVDPALTAVN